MNRTTRRWKTGLLVAALALAFPGCTREERATAGGNDRLYDETTEGAATGSDRSAEAAAQLGEAGQSGGAVTGLRVPLPGETFTIDGETWEVVASEVAVSVEDLPQDTRILDVTVSARRSGVEPLPYLGQDETPAEPER
jgi:hypothetical protein